MPPKQFPFALKTISLWPFSDSLRGFVKLKLQLLSTLLCALCALCGKLIHSLTTPKIFRNEFSFLGKQKKSRNIHKQNAVILCLDGACPRNSASSSPVTLTMNAYGISTVTLKKRWRALGGLTWRITLQSLQGRRAGSLCPRHGHREGRKCDMRKCTILSHRQNTLRDGYATLPPKAPSGPSPSP